jgi:hypothetical protein
MIRKMDVGHAPRLVWHLVRLPALALLLALAPVVETVCGTLMLLGLLVSGARAHFPFWPMIALSLAFGVFLVAYHALIGLLSR